MTTPKKSEAASGHLIFTLPGETELRHRRRLIDAERRSSRKRRAKVALERFLYGAGGVLLFIACFWPVNLLRWLGLLAGVE